MKTDFIVIGSGLAGLTSSLILARYGKVLLVTKGKLSDGSTNWAQGGIACAVAENDSWRKHYQDTLIAGAYHNDKKAVEFLVKNAPMAIDWLAKLGVPFEMLNGKYKTGREGGHSNNRIIHATDFTGKEIERVLTRRVWQNKNIKIWENTFAKKLLVKDGECFGVEVIFETILDRHCYSRITILATGGLGQIYQWTTNPTVSTGDGFALVYEAGAKLADMEFVQFHPTALKYGKSPLFLLSEALRGEGAYLKKFKVQSSKFKVSNGERFMKDYDRRLELAPRDIVARAIFNEQQKGFEACLDIRHKGEKFLQKRFPNIYHELKKRGFDLARDLIPVTPAAHFSCGGVKTDLYGRTNIKGLFAFGEVACTGVHGANRLASNSLLEAVVFPLRLNEIMMQKSMMIRIIIPKQSPDYNNRRRKYFHGLIGESKINNISEIYIERVKKNLQKLMWEKVGIVRRHKDLKDAKRQIEKWEKESENYNGVDIEILELKNMISSAKLITQAALNRHKSLGSHYIST